MTALVICFKYVGSCLESALPAKPGALCSSHRTLLRLVLTSVRQPLIFLGAPPHSHACLGTGLLKAGILFPDNIVGGLTRKALRDT